MALPKSAVDREYQKFVETTDGDVAIRALIDEIEVGDISIGAVEIKDHDGTDRLEITSANAAKVDGSAVTQPVSASALPLPSGAATSSKQDDVIAELDALNSLVPSVFDYILLSYTGANLTGVVFKNGGASGSVVSTLTLGYDGSSNLTSVTKS